MVKIRIANRLNGDIEAACGLGVATRCMTLDPGTGAVLTSDVKEGTDLFRWLVRAAREVIRNR
jgi:hypothetical protein